MSRVSIIYKLISLFCGRGLLCLLLGCSYFVLIFAEERGNPPNKPQESLSTPPGYSPLDSDGFPIVPSVQDKPTILPTSQKPDVQVPDLVTNQLNPSEEVKLQIEGSKPEFEIDNIPTYNPTSSLNELFVPNSLDKPTNTPRENHPETPEAPSFDEPKIDGSQNLPIPVNKPIFLPEDSPGYNPANSLNELILPNFLNKPTNTPGENHPETPETPSFGKPTIDESQNFPDPVNKPSVLPEGRPGYIPGSVNTRNPIIPDFSAKPVLIPLQSLPLLPNLQNVPYGYPGKVIFYDSTLGDLNENLSTSKQVFLQSGSLNSEIVENLTDEEADALANLGISNSDEISNALELRKKLNLNDDQNNDGGIQVIKLISEKNLDSGKLLTLDFGTLKLLAGFSDKTTTEAESALKVAELVGESGLKLATDKNLDIEKLSQRNTAEINLISTIGSDAQKAQSALKVAEIGGESGLKLATEKNLDIEKLSKRNTAEINLISSIGTDTQKAESALKVAEIGGEGGLKLATEKNLDIEKLSQRNTAEINLISSIGLDSQKAESAMKVAELGGESGLKLATEKNLDIQKLSQRNTAELNLISTIGSDSNKASQALSITEKFDSSNRQSSEMLLQGISKVSQSDSTKVNLFLDAVSDTDSAILVNKAESFSKVSNNTELVSSLNRVTTKTGEVINPVSRLIKMNVKLLEEIGVTENLEDENLKSVVNIISDGFIPSGAAKPSEIQLSDIENLGTDDGTNMGAQIAADLINSESSEELAKEMEEMIPPVLAANGNLYASEIEKKLFLFSQLPKSKRRFVDPLDTDDYKIAVRDVFIEDYLELGVSKVSLLGLKNLFNLSNDSAKNLYLSSMSGSSLEDFSNNVDLAIPDELDAVMTFGKTAGVLHRANLKRRQSSTRLAKMGYPYGDDLISAFASKAFNEAQLEKDLFSNENNHVVNQSQVERSNRKKFLDDAFAQLYVSDTKVNYHDLDGNGIGLTLEIDQHISDNLTLGISGGVSKSSTDDSFFSMESNSLFSGFYLNYVRSNYYLDAMLNLGYHGVEAQRLGLDDVTYFSSPSVTEKTVNLSFGRILDYNRIALNPYFSFHYELSDIGEYDEIGGIGAHKIHKQETDFMVGEIGLECTYYDFLPNGLLMIPEFRLSWKNEFHKDEYDLLAELIDSRASYQISRQKVDSGYGKIGIGSTLVVTPNKTAYFHYDYNFANEKLKSQTINIGFRLNF